MAPPRRVAVIGGGASGLVTLKYLKSAGALQHNLDIDARLFEADATVGGTFHHGVYEDAELVSSKYLTSFSDFRCADDGRDFLSARDYRQYLDDYATEFHLWPHIHLSTRVVRVSRSEERHIVTYLRGGVVESWECDALAICTGLHSAPNVPYVKGIENVSVAIHSSQFKEKQQFGINTNILILGSGETAMDLAYMAVTHPTRSVTLCHRDGFLSAPKVTPYPKVFYRAPPSDAPNIPTDSSFASLFDSAYVHPLVEKSKFLHVYYSFFIRNIFWLISGTSAGLDQWVGGLPKVDSSRVFFNKSTKAMPYISAPFRSNSWGERLRRAIIQVPLADTGDRVIDLAPWPEYIDDQGIVHFQENGRPEAERMRGRRCQPDMVIHATGYVQAFDFLDTTYPTPDQADFRKIWKTHDDRVAFIGFVRPGLGAIPPLSELQAQLWVLNLVRGLPPPDADVFYAIAHKDPRRVYYGVDHETYAYQLAKDMGSAPSFGQVCALGWRVAVVWALGPNFNPKFRLVGPWRWEGAVAVMRGELWHLVRRRGGVVYDVTSWVIPAVLVGTASLVLYVVCGVFDLLCALAPITRRRML